MKWGVTFAPLRIPARRNKVEGDECQCAHDMRRVELSNSHSDE